MIAEYHFKLLNGHGQTYIESILADRYTYIVEAPVVKRWAFYDTFDWRLFNKSWAFQQSEGELVLSSLANGAELQRAARPTPVKFIWDLSPSPLKEQLTPILKARALLDLAGSYGNSTVVRVLNKDEKTVARLIYTEIQTASDNDSPVLASYISLRPLRGYPKYERQLAKLLAENEQLTAITSDIYSRTLAASGKTPGSYTAKLNLQLEPVMRADEATKIIMCRLLETMRDNEAGVREDIDIEFLHEFRIAVRRTRSALSQVKGVFAPEITGRFKGDFRIVGKLSNELRDLDVYLLAEPTYHAMLPQGMRDDVTPLFDYLRHKRVQALNDVVTGLSSERYQRLLTDWEAFLHRPVAEDEAGPNSAVAIGTQARKRIYKRYRRVVNDGNKILEHTEDQLLHDLRLECKKLRYLLEFFASLFPPKKVARLIKQLKRLQDNLGEFTDLDVQQAYLLAIAEELPLEGTGTRKALIATGFLVETLARRQQVVKDEFAATFTHFASAKNQQQYRQLFAAKGKKGKK